MKYSEYSDLGETSIDSYDAKAPEEEFFHSVYIGGQPRPNHLGITEKAGHLHVRGVEYNLDEVYFVVTHTKNILAKFKKVGERDKLDCFCYQLDTPWKGTSGKLCPKNSAARKEDDYCANCKGQIIMAGILTEKSGKPKKDENGKPIFVFVRGKGIKYSGVSEYINEMSKLDLDPIFTPVTEETKKFEKSVVNIKRFITRITIGTANSNYGTKTVFKFDSGAQLPDSQVPVIMKISKETLPQFHEKFDWSKKQTTDKPSGFDDEEESTSQFDDYSAPPEKADTKNSKKGGDELSFDDISF